MKRLIFFSLSFLTLLSATLKAQDNNKPFQFGLLVAPSLGWFSPDVDNYKNDGIHVGFAWGFSSDIAIANNYFLSTGFNVQYLNGKMNYPTIYLKDGSSEEYSGTLYRTYHLRYLEIPFMLKMKTVALKPYRLFADIGFGLGFNLKAKADDSFLINDNPTGNNVITSNTSITNDVTTARLTFKIGGGVDFPLDGSTYLFTAIHLNSGLSDILSGKNAKTSVEESASASWVALTLGIMF